MQNEQQKFLASAVISELQSSDIYLTLKARLFDLKANLNKVKVTEAFLDEIIENEDKYVCIPLYADIRGLLANKTIGHMYNARTGEFYSTQIGSFYKYEKEVDGDDTYLVGYARVPKRNKALCKAITDLFTDNALKFSFEINCGSYSKDEDGTVVIDADEKNYFEGECIVTFPACEGAIAQQLVAECLDGKGDENMDEEKIVNAETEDIENQEETKDETAEVQEENEPEQTEENEENVETAETEVAETESAERIVVTEEHTTVDEVRAYDCDTGAESSERVIVETMNRTPIEISEESVEETAENNTEVADSHGPDCDCEDEEQEEPEETAECSDKDKKTAETVEQPEDQTAEQRIDTLEHTIAELKSVIEKFVSELNKPKTEETVVAETITGTEEKTEPMIMNPFMASISVPKKYSLLDSVDENTNNKYKLLDSEN